MEAAGVKNRRLVLTAFIVMGVVEALGNEIAASLLDYVGRKRVLVWGGLGERPEIIEATKRVRMSPNDSLVKEKQRKLSV